MAGGERRVRHRVPDEEGEAPGQSGEHLGLLRHAGRLDLSEHLTEMKFVEKIVFLGVRVPPAPVCLSPAGGLPGHHSPPRHRPLGRRLHGTLTGVCRVLVHQRAVNTVRHILGDHLHSENRKFL